MKIDDIQIEAVAKNNLWATLTYDGATMVFTDYRHPGKLYVNREGDILWITPADGDAIGVSTTFPLTILLDTYLPAVLRHFVNGGAKPSLPAGVLVAPPIADFPSDVSEDDNLPPVGDTTRKQVIEARVGQGLYRDRLLAKWNNSCAVTGLVAPEFLVASHARPWKGATNDERLDGDNGLPLIPNLDKLFDKGFITFEDDGTIRISPALPSEAYGPMGISCEMRLIRPLEPAQKRYMSYHRDFVFKRTGQQAETN